MPGCVGERDENGWLEIIENFKDTCQQLMMNEYVLLPTKPIMEGNSMCSSGGRKHFPLEEKSRSWNEAIAGEPLAIYLPSGMIDDCTRASCTLSLVAAGRSSTAFWMGLTQAPPNLVKIDQI